MKDFNKIIELIKEKDYMKLLLELIEMYPNAYEEIKKCLSKEINLEARTYDCKLGNRDHCCWTNSNSCCGPRKPGQMCATVITTCCKRVVSNHERKTSKIEYYIGSRKDLF